MMVSQHRFRHGQRRVQRERGGALLMAMVIVTLVTTLAASMVWMQWRAVQVESAERSLVQSQWVLRGFLDYGRIILREDVRNGGQDHLGEQWAVPLEEVSIASFLSADKDNTQDAPEGFLSGQILDATARYHLYNLLDLNPVDNMVVINAQQLAVFKRLCEYAAVSPAVADVMSKNLRRVFNAWDNADEISSVPGEDGLRAAPLRPQTLDQLIWLGVDAATVERLRPFVVIFPFLPISGGASFEAVPINVNTASREVLAAVVPGLDLARADRLVQARQKKPFVEYSDIQGVVGQLNLNNAQNRLSTKSKYFELQGRMRLSDRVLVQRYIVEREDSNVRTLVDNTVFGVESPNATAKGP
jgi:general secretion pathway protein K